MEVIFMTGVATGIAATLFTIRMARKMKAPIKTWLAGKIQALNDTPTN